MYHFKANYFKPCTTYFISKPAIYLTHLEKKILRLTLLTQIIDLKLKIKKSTIWKKCADTRRWQVEYFKKWKVNIYPILLSVRNDNVFPFANACS